MDAIQILTQRSFEDGAQFDSQKAVPKKETRGFRHLSFWGGDINGTGTTAQFPLTILDADLQKRTQCDVCRVVRLRSSMVPVGPVRHVSNRTSSDERILRSCCQTRIHRCHNDWLPDVCPRSTTSDLPFALSPIPWRKCPSRVGGPLQRTVVLA